MGIDNGSFRVNGGDNVIITVNMAIIEFLLKSGVDVVRGCTAGEERVTEQKD